MSVINIFKIENDKFEEFENDLGVDPIEKTFANNGSDVACKFYLMNEAAEGRVKWNWVLTEFDQNEICKYSLPVGVLQINWQDSTYALTFGNAYHAVEKYCDHDFAFELAKRFRYEKIKATAQTNPNSNKSKTVFSYANSNYFEYESGESFLKIKGNVKLDPGFTLFKKNIEVGTSIKLAIPNDNVRACIRIIEFIQNKMFEDRVTKIPIFNKVKDKTLIESLDIELQADISTNDFEISFADFDIVGTSEVFYSAFTKYQVSYGHHRKNDLDIISKEEVETFFTEKRLNYADVVLGINVLAYEDNGRGEYFTIKELIDYTNEDRKCVLLKGEWYQYNDDYLEALKESLDEITVVHDASFDWDQNAYDNFIASKKTAERGLPKFAGLDEVEFDKKIRNKYYPELVYNQLLSDNHGYTLMDRENANIDGQKVEVCDLYKDNTIFAVKIGKSSSKLCYAIDQLITSATLIKRKEILMDEQINKACLWLVLERQSVLPLTVAGKPDINELEMLVLKNKIDSWKKSVYSQGWQPIVYIGYRIGA